MSGHEKYIEEENFRYDLEFEVFTDRPECVSVCAAHLQINLQRPDVIRLRDQLNDWLDGVSVGVDLGEAKP